MSSDPKFVEFSDVPDKNIEINKEEKPAEVLQVPSIEPYQVYFNVDTFTVFYHIKKTLWPFDRKKFIESQADLYGAFWIPTTLIFLLSVAGSIAAKLSPDQGYTFKLPTMIGITFLIYFFTFTVPALLSWVLLSGYDIKFVDLLSLYGYSYFIFFCFSDLFKWRNLWWV